MSHQRTRMENKAARYANKKGRQLGSPEGWVVVTHCSRRGAEENLPSGRSRARGATVIVTGRLCRHLLTRWDSGHGGEKSFSWTPALCICRRTRPDRALSPRHSCRFVAFRRRFGLIDDSIACSDGTNPRVQEGNEMRNYKIAPRLAGLDKELQLG